MRRYVLTLSCPDRPGIVNAITGALLEADANIVESAQYSDIDTGRFAMRTVFDTPISDADEVNRFIDRVGDRLGADIEVRAEDQRPRALIMVSRYDHCLLDILHRHRHGELQIEIPVIVSNHEDCAELAARYEIPYRVVPVDADSKSAAETRLLELIEENDIDFVVLARYMQILSADLCERLPGRIINIHHSFLPGFKGARPYHQAHQKGVKVIGATAHYVTTNLDEGPIIEQDVERVTHADTVEDLIILGRDIERRVLSRAVRYHAENRVILLGPKTIVFS